MNVLLLKWPVFFRGGGPVSPVLQGHTYYFNFIYGMPDLGELSG